MQINLYPDYIALCSIGQMAKCLILSEEWMFVVADLLKTLNQKDNHYANAADDDDGCEDLNPKA